MDLKKEMHKMLIVSVLLLGMNACQNTENQLDSIEVNSLFTELSAAHTGVDFENTLVYDEDFNIYTYRNFYNGGGVALGDINNDGLIDIYFTANMQANRLYLNQGDLKFKDVSKKAGIGGDKGWSTGVAMADVNADGWLDIYVCNSGDRAGDNKANELYINNQDGTFSEQAAEYGIADEGLSTHGVFFDYDRDGDLDLYLLNNSFKAIGSFNLRKNERPKRDPIGGDKLYQNNDGQFIDVSEAAGIYGSIIGFGLGVTVGDIDQDGWQDIYISNDFFERDYIYMNNGDGTFREELEEQMKSISAASMGADMADINNDGYPEVFVTEMLPEKDADIKQKTTFESWDRYQYNLDNDYYHQFTRNMLQLNNGDGTFSEIGRLAGVEATDWSWGALMFDMDNDGWKDIFVANGIYQDLTDQDYINFISDEETKKSIITNDGVNFKILIDSIPIRPVPNYAFQNKGDLSFVNKASEWGLDQKGHSNGSAYGDLDNDGDLDLVINNVNMPALVIRNETDTLLANNHYIKFDLKGEGANPYAVGSHIRLQIGNEYFYQEQMPMRGFQSSMDYRPNFGIGKATMIDSVWVNWSNGKVTTLANVTADQTLVLRESEAVVPTKIIEPEDEEIAVPLFTDLSKKINLDFRHKENRFVDFDRDRLLYHMVSTAGPKIAKGDINSDGRDDLFLCGAKDMAGELWLQTANGQFKKTNIELLEKDKVAEDVDATFFDADSDGDLDLYVASGGNEFSSSSSALRDRLYLNNGHGIFTKDTRSYPSNQYESSSCVAAADYDGDGDQDLFVGVRLRPWLYGVPTSAYLLQNDGKGNFTNITEKAAPALQEIGMVTDFNWADIDGDKDQDLLIVGDWMGIKVLENQNAKFTDISEQVGLENTEGWWNCIEASDLDGDGDIDFVLGNHGENSRFRANEETPLVMYINDFDENGTAEQILCRYEDDVLLPFTRRGDLVMQMPQLKKKYLRYNKYVGQTMEDIFSKEVLERSVVVKAKELATSILLNDSKGNFTLKTLPKAAQLAPVYGIEIADFNKDGKTDILLGGNFYAAKPEVGRYDASYGLYLEGIGKGDFMAVPTSESGLKLEGEVRDIIQIKKGNQEIIVVARNNEELQIFEAKNKL